MKLEFIKETDIYGVVWYWVKYGETSKLFSQNEYDVAVKYFDEFTLKEPTKEILFTKEI